MKPVAPEIELTAAFNPVFFGGYADFARELSGTFRENGILVRPVTKTIDEFLEAQDRATADLVVGRWAADYPDADTFVYQLHQQGGSSGHSCGTPAIDRLIERGRVETAAAARHAVYREIEEIIATEALLLPLFYEQSYRFARPEIEGLTLSFWGQTVAYENLRLRQ